MKQLLIAIILLTNFSAYAAPEVWLLSGKDCNVCSLFDEVSQQRGYGDTLKVNSTLYPIKHIDKNTLPKFLQTAIGADELNTKHWPQQLTVAIVDNKQLILHGNIAESADFNQAQLNQVFMKPQANVTLDELHDYGFNYLAFFKQQFNLEYFVNVAFNNTARHASNELNLQLVSTNDKASPLSLWASAMQPANNDYLSPHELISSQIS